MRIIDAHVHLYPDAVNRDPAAWAELAREPAWATLSTRIRKNGRVVQDFPSVEELLRAMDAAGVERAVLLGWYWQQPATCTLQNRFYAECVRAHPDRLSAFATVQPLAGPEAVETELHRARAEGLVGLGELSPHAQGYGVAAPGFARALALAGAWGWPVNLHVTDPATRDYPGRVATPAEDFVGLAREHADVTFILAHWGGLLPLRDPGASSFTNLYYDTAASPLTYDESVWQRMLAVVPPERVLFGSDYPLHLYPRGGDGAGIDRFVAEARLHGTEAVRWKNAARLLKLGAESELPGP